MKIVLLIFATLGIVAATPNLESQYSEYKRIHGKNDADSNHKVRLEAFSKSVELITAHNARYDRGEETYQLGLTPLSDLTNDEIRTMKFGARINNQLRASLNVTKHRPSLGGAGGKQGERQYVDWRGKAVSSVKDQGRCGSCYTFGAAGAIESTLMRKTKGEKDLSEQELVDCSFNKYSQGFNFGCDGGDPAITISHALKHGVASEKDYPYESANTHKQGRCKEVRDRTKLNDLKIYRVDANEEALADAVLKGPIAVTLNGENQEFYHYKGGIYNNRKCSTHINHSVLLVGVGKENGQEYWIIKNSWGPQWGDKGFMKLAKGSNLCGIVTADSYYVD